MIGRIRRLILWIFCWTVILLILNVMRMNYRYKHGQPETESYIDFNIRNAVWTRYPVLKTLVSNSIYFFSAIGLLDEEGNTYSGVVVIGWEEHLVDEAPDIMCYLMYKSEYISEHNATVKSVFSYANGSIVNFMCPVKDQSSLPFAVALRLSSQSRPEQKDFLSIYYPTHQVGKLALCPKVAFGYLNAQKLIEWFEMQRLLGVDHVVILVMDRLNDEAVRVFQHYRKQGMAHLHPYENRQKKRNYMWPAYTTESQAALAHCWYAMKGYTYASILDFDEFIVPAAKDTIKDLLQRLRAKVPNAGTFTFHQKVFPTDSIFPKNKSYTYLGSHGLCSRPIQERAKNIYLNNRTLYTISSHSVLRKGKYERLRVEYEDALFYHYRSCPGYANCSLEYMHYEDGLRPYIPVLEKSLERLRQEMPDLFLNWNETL